MQIGGRCPGVGEQFQREVRLGLVLYGGVSLAIYINGVAQELFNIVKGRGVYRLLKALTDSDVVVDIVSGTSAGGINGVFLSYALCNDCDFSSCAELWRKQADFQKLLRPIDTAQPPSVLNSEGFFQQQLELALKAMGTYKPEKDKPEQDAAEWDRRWESQIEALDLFVTATDYDGAVTTRLDSLGHLLEVKDHRKVFKLKFRGQVPKDTPGRPDRRNDFQSDEARIRALAMLARITATFPGAFAPADVPGVADTTPDPQDAKAFEHLRTWGAFAEKTTFLDGGVLDNKPFSYTIRDIYYRTSERKVLRKLLYVEPDPERFDKVKRAAPPDFFNVILASLIGIPGYESIADDLREIDQHNLRLNRYEDIVRTTRLRPGIIQPATETQRGIYRQSRIALLRDGLAQSLLSVPGARSGRNGRDEAVRKLFELLVKRFNGLRPADKQRFLRQYDAGFAIRRLFYVTYYIYERLYKTEPGDLKRRYKNLLYALNRQIHVLKVVQYAINRWQDAMNIFGEDRDVGHVWWDRFENSLRAQRIHQAHLLWLEIEGMLRALLAPQGVNLPGLLAVEPLPQRFEQAYGQLPGADDDWKRFVPDANNPQVSGWLPDETVTELAQAFKRRLEDKGLEGRARTLSQRFNQLLENAAPEPVVPGTQTVIQRLEDLTQRIIDHLLPQNDPVYAGDPVRYAYTRFEEIDTYLFPLEYLTGLQEKDTIEIVRVSPLDAQRGFSRRPASEKISGDALHHFGGFFKRSWRSNDILWGRLDAVNLLLESLLTEGRVRAVVESPARRREVKARLAESGNPNDFDAATLIQELFPKSSNADREAIASWLRDLLGDQADAGPRNVALEDLAPEGRLRREGKLEKLIIAAQREILDKDLDEVIKDAVNQSVEWGSVKRVEGEQHARFERLDLDPLVAEVVKDVSSQVVDTYVRKEDQEPHEAGHQLIERFREGLARLPVVSKIFARPKAPEIRDKGRFFADRYRVGTEEVGRDIPPLILVQTISHALIVLKNVVATALERHKITKWVLGTRLFRYLLDYPLWVIHAIARLAQRQPGLGALQLTCAALAMALLAIGIGWRRSIWWLPQSGGGSDLHIMWATVFVAIPIVVLAAQALYLRWKLVHRSALARGLLATRAMLAIAAVTLVGYGIYVGQYEAALAWWEAVNLKELLTTRTSWFFAGPPLLLLLCWFLRRQ